MVGCASIFLPLQERQHTLNVELPTSHFQHLRDRHFSHKPQAARHLQDVRTRPAFPALARLHVLANQGIVLEHSTPSGATVALDFHRGYADATTSLTPSTSSTLVVSRDFKELTFAARAATEACYLGFRQSAGGASELRGMELRVKRLPSYK